MITDLRKITAQLEYLINNFTDPPEERMLETASEIHNIRAHVIALDQLVRAVHNRRHPIPKVEVDMTPTQPLDAETRAEIDATP